MEARKRVIEVATSGLNSRVRQEVREILASWKGKESSDRIVALLGEKEADRLWRKIRCTRWFIIRGVAQSVPS